MFTLSREQVRVLLPTIARLPDASLLDVGAGDGGVTARMAPLFRSVTATEVSGPMCRRLRRRGYTTVQTATIGPSVFPKDASFDVVTYVGGGMCACWVVVFCLWSMCGAVCTQPDELAGPLRSADGHASQRAAAPQT
jgi:SAM-dependent methyltransferase